MRKYILPTLVLSMACTFTGGAVYAQIPVSGETAEGVYSELPDEESDYEEYDTEESSEEEEEETADDYWMADAAIYSWAANPGDEESWNDGGTEDYEDGLQATVFADLDPEDVIEKVGPLFTEDQGKSGILACVSLAQFILESGYGQSELAQNANNCFGMKENLSDNTWDGSVWDGVSVYTKKTSEQEKDGSYKNIIASFREYPSVEASIADHSAYLLGAMKGVAYRYGGLTSCTDYEEAFRILKNGGYATSHDYVKKLCAIVEKWDLTRYNQ